VEGAGKVGQQPPQRADARLAAVHGLHFIEDQDVAPAQRFLRVAEEDVAKRFDVPGAHGLILPQRLGALAEFRDVLTQSADEVPEEEPGVAVEGIQGEPDRVGSRILQEPGDETGLSIARSGQDGRGPSLEEVVQLFMEAGSRKMERSRRGGQQLGAEQRGRFLHGRVFGAVKDHCSSPA
jgi:hypothetical protein